jgi:hypothetical protein
MRRLNESLGFRPAVVETLAAINLGSPTQTGRHPR